MSDQAKKNVYAALAKKFKFDPNDKETLGIWDTTEFDKFIFYFNLGFNLFLANIMYVIVQERTREIGIRRSVGARRKNIFGQLLLEAFVVIGIGAAIGFTLALILIKLIAAIPIQEFKDAVGVPIFDPWVAIITVLILGTIGFLAGFFPARRASKLNVIDCLRY